jgi:hypothetical protein
MTITDTLAYFAVSAEACLEILSVLLVLVVNIKLSRKTLSMTNTLAYFAISDEVKFL